MSPGAPAHGSPPTSHPSPSPALPGGLPGDCQAPRWSPAPAARRPSAQSPLQDQGTGALLQARSVGLHLPPEEGTACAQPGPQRHRVPRRLPEWGSGGVATGDQLMATAGAALACRP